MGQFSAACGQVEDGRGCHMGSLHVVTVVKAALAAGTAGAATPTPSASSRAPSSTSTAQAATATAGSIGAGGAAG